MTHLLRLFATALTFFTRLPFARWSYADAACLASAAPLFPLVGAVVAAVVIAVALVANLCLPASVVPWCALAAGIVVTGAFHEDGLSDTADGLGGGWTLERKLEIMKDSRIGSYGAVALCIVLGGKYVALATLPPAGLLAALWTGHVLARWSVLPLAAGLPYVRAGTPANKPVADGIGLRHAVVGSFITAALVLPLGRVAWCAAVGSALVVALAALYYRRQLGGITGDTLGAANQVVELACYLIFAGATRWT
ncbi:adenosylcobinamide-GDP ribazoletransferase [Tahibacter amnicola]|uniref:Adenosylcobinamide-GDP ribazoletransferase n=1 Tax=Tahibacter amnicola TaxID=2976241 RepID=A0ABY6BHT0_9GAMM|nr:adenosylcobinamide-GDP ribazoletransferase [Tahibacter amnicola]UXI67422.1 adenosylcobinamide-GDP ribazoletransferase [Tahibacter amnicola]